MRDLAREAYGHYVERIGREPGPMSFDYDAVVREADCWIVVTRIAGSGTATSDDDIAYLVLRDGPDHLVLDNVAVSPGRQGQGIGTRLLEFAEQQADERGFNDIRLFTHETMVENIAFYGRHGYVETERREEYGLRRVFFVKHITRA